MCYRQNDNERDNGAIDRNSSFNPAASKICCCHVRSFTILSGIIEIFLLFFNLIAVVPEINNKFCEANENLTSNSSVSSSLIEDFIKIGKFPRYNSLLYGISSRLCGTSVAFLIWSLLQIVSVTIMFYGIKALHWCLMLPNIGFRMCCMFIFIVLMFILIILAVEAPDQGLVTIFSIGATISGISITVIIFCMYVEFSCLYFVKRSRETGISLTATQAVHPPTLSFDNQNGIQGNEAGRRILPPLRNATRREPHYAASAPNVIDERKEEDSL